MTLGKIRDYPGSSFLVFSKSYFYKASFALLILYRKCATGFKYFFEILIYLNHDKRIHFITSNFRINSSHNNQLRLALSGYFQAVQETIHIVVTRSFLY